MIDFVVKEIKDKASLCGFYMGKGTELATTLTKEIGDVNTNHTVLIKQGTYTLEQYIEFKKRFYFSTLLREDTHKHIIAANTLYELFLFLSKQENKKPEDYFTPEEIKFLESNADASLGVTAKVKNEIVFKNPEVEKFINDRLAETAPAEFEKLLNS